MHRELTDTNSKQISTYLLDLHQGKVCSITNLVNCDAMKRGNNFAIARKKGALFVANTRQNGEKESIKDKLSCLKVCHSCNFT